MKDNHVLSEQIEAKIYLKTKFRPFVIIFDNERQKENFFQALHTSEIITVGPITFLTKDLRYIELQQ